MRLRCFMTADVKLLLKQSSGGTVILGEAAPAHTNWLDVSTPNLDVE